MTIIFKSNETATSYLFNIAKTPVSGYALAANFADGVYVKNDDMLSFSEVINYTRAGEAYDYKNNSFKAIAANVPQLLNPVNGNVGLWVQGKYTNILGAGVLKTTKTFTIPKSVKYTAFQVFGGADAKITITGDVLESKTITPDEPANIELATRSDGADPVVTVTVSGGVAHYQAINIFTRYDTIYGQPTVSTREADKASVNNAVLSDISGDFTFVLNSSLAHLGRPRTSEGLFTIQTESGSINFLYTASSSISASFVSNANQVTWLGEVAHTLNSTNIVTCKDGVVTCYTNNSKRATQATLSSGTKITSLMLGEAKSSTAPYSSFNGLFKSFVLYDRCLTDDEINSIINYNA